MPVTDYAKLSEIDCEVNVGPHDILREIGIRFLEVPGPQRAEAALEVPAEA